MKTKHLYLISAILSTQIALGQDIESNLVGHYKFNGNALDSSAGANHLTAHNNGDADPIVQASGGKSGGYATFDGQNLFNTSFAPVTGNAARTFSMFVRTNEDNSGNAVGFNTLMFGGWGENSNQGRYDFGLDGNSNTSLRSEYQVGATTSDTTTTITNGQWNHVAVVWDGTDTSTFYLNGALYGSEVFATGLNTQNLVGLTLGADTVSADSIVNGNGGVKRFHIGDLDDVRVYDAALDASQIGALAAIPEPASATTIIGGLTLFLAAFRRMNRRQKSL